jgi:1-acyl-sn-glycerol-3-phosphate acyltransferase
MKAKMESSSRTDLSRMEKTALALGRFANEHPLAKRLQFLFLENLSQPWVKAAIARRVYTENLHKLLHLAPDRGVLLASNHRTFFDLWLAMLPLFHNKCAWLEKVFFPVRSTFFYESPAGLLINFAIGGGAMYPPIFRDPRKAARNEKALDRISKFLADPGVLVGIHPEGTRNKGDDPYTLLPAQPGVGQIALRAAPIVIPMFVNGLSNVVAESVLPAWTPGGRNANPVVIVYGDPIEYSDLASKKPRLALYKNLSDRIHSAIVTLGQREREVRQGIVSGAIDDGHPGWLIPLATDRAARARP